MSLEQYFNELSLEDKKEFVLNSLQSILNEDEKFYKRVIELKNNNKSELEKYIEKVEELFDIEIEAVNDFIFELGKNNYIGYFFDKSIFEELFENKLVNNKGVINTIVYKYNELLDAIYSIPNEIYEEDQVEDLKEMLKNLKKNNNFSEENKLELLKCLDEF